MNRSRAVSRDRGSVARFDDPPWRQEEGTAVGESGLPVVENEWKRGWRTVASGSVGVVFMTGIPSVTGIVMAPLMAEFGWSRAVITANVLINAVMSLLLAPVLGRLIARFGARRCAIAAVIAAVPGLLLIATAGGSASTWIGAWTLFAVINVGLSPMMWSGAVAGLFDRARGIALAITLSGAGIAYFVFPPFAVLMLQRFGWRGVYVGSAVLMLALLLPMIYAWFRGRSELDANDRPTAGPNAAARLPGFTLGQAARTRQFWQFALLAALVALAEGALQVHLYPILHEGGLNSAMAAWIASLMGIAMIVGRLLTGFLLDRLPPLPVFAASMLTLLASCLLARGFTGNLVEGAAVSLCLGLGAGGTINALAYLTSRYFGLAAYAAIFGLLMGSFSVGYGIAPVVAGYMREAAQSYVPIFDWLAGALVASTLLTLSLGRPGLFQPEAPGGSAGADSISSSSDHHLQSASGR